MNRLNKRCVITKYMSSSRNFEVKIVFDNNCLEGFKKGWGFGAIILNNHSKNTILFDTGTNFSELAHNIEKFNIKLEDIKKVVISHDHMDHAGGLLGLLRKNPNVDLYVAASNKATYLSIVPPGVRVHGIETITEIDKNTYCSDELGTSIKEISLFLKVNDEIIVITGCAHPSLDLIIENAKKMGKIKAILGGFHGFRKLEALRGIDLIAPCHCTVKIEQIKQKFPDNYVEIKAGSELSF